MNADAPVVGDPEASIVADEPETGRNVLGLVKLLARYWWLALPGFFVTLVLAAVLPTMNHRSYQSRASIFLVDPTTAPSAPDAKSNPYLTGNSSLITTAGLLATTLSSDADELHAAGQMKSVVDVTVSEKPPEPLLYVVVTAEKADDAQRDIGAVVDLARRRLQEVQVDGAIDNSRYVAALSVEYSAPRQGETSRMRPLLAIVFLGFGLTVWCVIVVDRRRRRTGLPGRSSDAADEAVDR